MALYIYVTPQCDKDIQDHQMEDTVLNFKDRILQEQRTALFDRYPPPFLKKRFKRQERLIAAEIQIGGTDDLVVVFLRMFVRSGREYESFKNDPKGYGEKFFSEAISPEYLSRWLEANREIERPLEKRPPTEEEHDFLWKILSQDSNLYSEEFVFESEEWQKAIVDQRLQDRLITLPSSIITCMSDKGGDCRTYDVSSNIRILYRNFPLLNKLFLAGIFLDKPDAEIEATKEKYKFLLKNSQVNENDIIKASTRSYPGLILLDDDMWISIQKNQEANLALSPEESELLSSVYELSIEQGQTKGFPLFINGRAGSGKSTILQYLFSDYLGFYLKERVSSIKPPIYLTYSKDLVEKSRTSVFNILSGNYKHRFNNNTLDSHQEDLKEITNYCFIVFRDLLIRIIRENGIKEKFIESKYIDFKVFKHLWKQKFQGDPKATEKYGPDISWHVIRTYIKGYSPSDFIDEDEYEELPRDEKTVTKETFKFVFQKVWSNWYRQLCDQDDEKNAFWDDQDIARYIIENQLAEAVYPAIFCDEAQDFTRIELEFLFRISLFSDRKITSQDLNRVPFVFAGDPFQTLNPTGFNWDNIKAAFVQKFIYSLDPQMVYGNPKLHYKELSFNYRSSLNIVKLCNSIQALRALFFGHRNLEPQRPWQYEQKSRMPVYFKSEEPEVWERIKEFPDLRIIVPCAEGEEPEFVKNDVHLSQFIQTDETGVPRNVMSPLRSKGLEFERVVVYGFGKYCSISHFFESIEEHTTYSTLSDKEKLLSYEYYLNQLYVSVSRAQKLLIIVDSSEGLDSFWKFAIDPEFISTSYNHAEKDMMIWEDSIGVLSQGTNDIWTGNIEDKASTATRLESEGRDKKDPYILRQAAMIYKDMGQPLKEKQCKAMAYVFQSKFDDAGKLFMECELPNEAIINFWKAKNYQNLRDLGVKFPGLTTDLKIRAANQEKLSQMAAAMILFKDLIDNGRASREKLEIITDATWTHCINKILDNLLSSDDSSDANHWKSLAVAATILAEEDFIKISKNVGRILYKAEEYQKAINVFEKIGELSFAEYQDAKSRIVEEKINSVTSKDLKDLSEYEKKIAANIFMGKGKYFESASLFQAVGDLKMLLEVANAVYRRDGERSIDRYIKIIFSSFFEQKQFRQALSYFEENPKTSIKANAFYASFKKNIEFWVTFVVKEFAVSAFLPHADPIEQIKVSEFLRNQFIDNRFLNWRQKIHPLVVGAAMERAGKDIDCLKFYGSFEDSKEMGGILSIESKKRLAAIKIRQSLREEQERKVDISIRHRNEAEVKAKELGISLKDLPEFPSVSEYLSYETFPEKLREISSDPAEEVTQDESILPEELPQLSEFRLWGIDIKVSRANKKIQLTHTENLSSLLINLAKRELHLNDITVLEEGNDLVINDWNMRVNGYSTFVHNNNLILSFKNHKIELKVFF